MSEVKVEVTASIGQPMVCPLPTMKHEPFLVHVYQEGDTEHHHNQEHGSVDPLMTPGIKQESGLSGSHGIINPSTAGLDNYETIGSEFDRIKVEPRSSTSHRHGRKWGNERSGKIGNSPFPIAMHKHEAVTERGVCETGTGHVAVEAAGEVMGFRVMEGAINKDWERKHQDKKESFVTIPTSSLEDSVEFDIKSHDKGGQMQSSSCNYKSAKDIGIIRHVNTNRHDQPSQLHKCIFCDFTCSVLADMIRHAPCSHAGKKLYTCSQCGYSTGQIGYFTAHVCSQTRDRHTRICPLCSFRTDKRSSLLAHFRSHSRDKPYSYSTCTTGQIGNFTHHVCPQTCEQHICPLCDFRTDEKSRLVIHLRSHSGTDRYTCPKCDYRTDQKSSLVDHVCTQTGKHVCPQCDYNTHDSINLVAHLKMHIGDEPYRCVFCKYRSGDKAAYLTHHRKHRGQEKPYTCALCGEGFADAGQLRGHTTSEHRGKPYRCSMCKFMSRFSRELVIHLGMHIGEKLGWCDFVAAQKSKIALHMRNQAVKNPNCSATSKSRTMTGRSKNLENE